MKHPVEHLRFPEATVEAVTEFRQVTGQVRGADTMMDTSDIFFDIGDHGMKLGNRRICTDISGAYSENRLPLDNSEDT